MAERKSVRLEKQQLDAIKDMVERGIADNESEAHRMCLNAGKREFGYENGEYSQTTLLHFVQNAGWLLLVAGFVGLGFTFAYPVAARIPSVLVGMTGAISLAVADLLEDKEPDVTKSLKRLVGRSA